MNKEKFFFQENFSHGIPVYGGVLLSLLIFIINVPIGKRLGFPVPEFKSQI